MGYRLNGDVHSARPHGSAKRVLIWLEEKSSKAGEHFNVSKDTYTSEFIFIRKVFSLVL
ncbi:hypothetical protein [Holospora curviuscula]|uniref:hypothetical protein n=1 Tax=Holospora curviuscula TaxID=1082868 RepID=UPI001A9C8D02|nr:hypothetical protein [Holospora curviuscula]